MKRHAWLMLLPVWLAGCDQISERAGFPNSTKVEADGKAIGGACRHAGRGLEDCYRLNKGASKAAIYAGWKEMNEYMAKNNMQVVEPNLSPVSAEASHKNASAAEGEAHKPSEGEKAGKTAEHGGDKKTDAKGAAQAKDSGH